MFSKKIIFINYGLIRAQESTLLDTVKKIRYLRQGVEATSVRLKVKLLPTLSRNALKENYHFPLRVLNLL